MDIQTKVQIWRQKCTNGTITLEEMREAISYLRADRKAASAAAVKTKATKAKPNSDDLLKELEGL
jgi:hypothetical protein